MNWLLPLETLPGWPEAPEVSTPHMLFLLVVAPLAVGAIIALLAFTPALGRRFRGELSGAPNTEEHPALDVGTAPPRGAIEPQARHGEPELDA